MLLKKIIAALNILLVLMFAQSGTVYSQDSSFVKRLTFEIEPRWGFVAPHHDYMAYFLEKNVTGFQCNVGLLTTGTKDWHYYYNYPQIGLGFYHSGLGNDDIYGKMNALYLYVDRRFFPIQNRFNIGNRVAFGLSHVSKYFDKESNPVNIIIATPINAFIQYDLLAYYRLSPNFNVRLSFGFTHTSNGSIKDPNKGFNIIVAGLGVQYAISDERKVFKFSPESTAQRNHQLYAGLVYGCKSISRLDGKVYHIAGVSAEYLYRVSPTDLIGVETTVYWDPSNKDMADGQQLNSFENSDYINIALNLNYALKMGQLYFTFQPGIYLKNNINEYGLVTNKVGLRYHISPNLLASLSIKAHWLAKADFIEFGVKYNILGGK